MAAAVPDKSLCDLNQCIPSIFKTDDGPEERCATYNEGTCFIPDDVEKTFYKKINWPKLRSIKQNEMNEFMRILNASYAANIDGFRYLVRQVYPNLTARIHGHDVFFKANDISGKNEKCNDINFSFGIECQRYPPDPPVTKGRSSSKSAVSGPAVTGSAAAVPLDLRLFHIAIHSEKPKCYEPSGSGRVTRSMYACGYFENKGVQADDAAAAPQGSGPFHYKIDNYDILEKGAKLSKNQCESKIQEEQCPFKRFVPEVNLFGRATGKFEVFHEANVHFEKLFDQKCKANTDRFKNDHNLQTNFARLHSYIYKRFVTFWNNVLFPKVSLRSSPNVISKISSKLSGKISSLVSRNPASAGGSKKKSKTWRGTSGAKRRLTKKMKNSRRRVKMCKK